MAMDGLFDKIGVTTDVIRAAKRGRVFDDRAVHAVEREVMLKMMNEFYDQFTRKAAEGRKMDLAKLRDLAQGKLYTGRMAAANGLVEELGTLEVAVTDAKVWVASLPMKRWKSSACRSRRASSINCSKGLRLKRKQRFSPPSLWALPARPRS